MYRNKKDVDKHVENLLNKISSREFKSRAYSIARLYFEVGDFANCQKYVEQYLTQKDNNAAAYKLLGQALQKMGQKEKALEQYKTSLDIDPAQTSTILDICELLADYDVEIEPGRAKYWCEKAEAIFPRHPVTFRLRERLLSLQNPNPEALVKLITTELAIRPKDAQLHARLIKHYISTNKLKEAFEHSCNIEFGENFFMSNYAWYEILANLVVNSGINHNEWLYQLLLLTVRERLCVLSLTETPSGTSKSLVESQEFLQAYDQSIEIVAKTGPSPGHGDFHASLLQHHKGQFSLHAATLLLKRAKKDQLNWRDAVKYAAPLMLIAWQTLPLDPKVNWVKHAPEKQSNAVRRWFSEGTYRCSQAGHYLLSNIQDKNQKLDQISHTLVGTTWRETIYEKIFNKRSQLELIKSSYFASDAYKPPVLRLPRKIEVEAYDDDAQKVFGNSLHHYVWTLLNYKDYTQFRCTLFNLSTVTMSSCGPETLNNLDIYAFLYCATLTAHQQKLTRMSYVSTDKPNVLPAHITDCLCTLSQMKWWDCAYKFCQSELGTELTDIRATLSQGIEVVRCVDNHGLDPHLLCLLGQLFNNKAKSISNFEEKNHWKFRAALYYSSSIPLLEKLINKIFVKIPEKRMFAYINKEHNSKELNSLIEESKLYVASHHFDENEYDKVIDIASSLKSPEAYYLLGQTYTKIAVLENDNSKDFSVNTNSSFFVMMKKAKHYCYKALDRLRQIEPDRNHPLYVNIQDLIENIKTYLNRADPDVSINDNFKDDSDSSVDLLPVRATAQHTRNLSSTPKPKPNLNNSNMTNYRTAVDSQFMDTSRIDHQFLERIETEIRNLNKRDATINDFMQQTRIWFDENRNLGNQITNTIHSNVQITTDQIKLLKISVDHVKDQIDQCRNECKDVGELKKQIAELKIEVNKLKKPAEASDESDLYNTDKECRNNENTPGYATQLPYSPAQAMASYNQRLVPPFPAPPNPYHLYGQNFYNLYNHYAQIAQTSTPGTAPIFEHARSQMAQYPGVYPTPEQMFLDIAQLVPPAVPVPPVPTVPVPSAPTIPVVPATPITTVTTTAKSTVPVISTQSSISITSKLVNKTSKETAKSLPVNVVITSSDPLPTCTTAPPPILSVTIPPKHIKSSPHNYQIPMPSVDETKIVSPSVFSIPNSGITVSSSTNWSQSSIFKTTQSIPVLNKMGDISLIKDAAKTEINNASIDPSPNASLNKSRTISERSNTSIESYDPCPDFKPIVPLPAEIKVKTGEEDEFTIFSSRAKLFRFVDMQWKERGLGEIKLLKHKITGKVRVLMRREQVHKICANHVITSEMEISPMKNETKAYFWVANDFADEAVVLEMFCIRFKTSDIAQEFYRNFEKARLEAANSKTVEIHTDKHDLKNTTKASTPSDVSSKSEDHPKSTPGKSVLGGFTFSSTPNIKPIKDEKEVCSKPTETTVGKSNPFTGFSLKSMSSSPFSNLSTVNTNIFSKNTTPPQDAAKKLNISDTVEDFEPTAEFKPVVPLPTLIDQKTGEEDENVLFENRAKLLRFDASDKEWKERGLGNMKLLIHKENTQKVRLLMRREQTLKVCCNHSVTKFMIFQKMQNMEKAVTWCAKDFSEGELVTQTFCLRFKTPEQCGKFIDAVNMAQKNMEDESKTSKEGNNAATQNNQTGFGDKFKSKPGSWYCETCYTNNLESFDKCACCEQQKPQLVVNNKELSFGDKFKKHPGTWECPMCLIRNEIGVKNCIACKTLKDPSETNNKPEPEVQPLQYSYGIPGQNAKTLENKTIQFQNTNIQISTDSKASIPKFKFGIAPASHESNEETNSEVDAPTSTSIFDGTGTHTFKFGIPSNLTVKPQNSLEIKKPMSTMFDSPKTSVAAEKPLNINLKIEHENESNTAVLSKSKDLTFGSNESGTFNFVFKPKTPVKSKSPLKNPKSPGEDSDGNDECVSEEESSQIQFTPVIPLPDEVQVVTGEENETELYGHRAKLYRFMAGEWKERGIGVVKILKHKDTGKLRVVMRREQVLKICLNYALAPEITFTPKDEKTWLFAANDYSEGELSLQQFCLRFANKETATEFKDAVDKARDGKSIEIMKKDDKCNSESISRKSEQNIDEDDVIFVSETVATVEEKQKAKDLLLPENFYNYKCKDPCQGCRGCKENEFVKKTDSPVNISNSTNPLEHMTMAALLSTPSKTTPSSFQSPTNSLYGTPSNFEKTCDTSIFRTPLGSIGSLKSDTPTSTIKKSDLLISKENDSIQKPSVYSTSTVEEVEATEINSKSKGVILAPPKLTNVPSNEQKAPEKSSIFTSGQNKPMFDQSKFLFGSAAAGTSSNKSIFSYSSDNSPKNPNDDVKSIFGGAQKDFLFSNVAQSKIFGPGSIASNQSKPSIFSTQPQTEEKKNVFVNNDLQCGNNATINSNQKKTNEDISEKSNVAKKEEINSEGPFRIDNKLSFAALSTGSGDNFQKKADFQWEGAGQQLFAGGQRIEGDNSKTESNAVNEKSGAAGDEEYDPYYEPIVPLPEKIVITTGEEDEEKLFGERCKLFRYNESQEWKERGVGEIKILYHPERKTYRFLLRREQVHKAVLNMLLFADLELHPMKNSDRAWIWAGINYAEDPSGQQETLAVRFKSIELFNEFGNKVVQCIKKLQDETAAKPIEVKKSQETNEASFTNPMRLPKHLQDSARADYAMTAKVEQQTQRDEVVDPKPEAVFQVRPSPSKENFTQVQFQEMRQSKEYDIDEEYDDDNGEDNYDEYDPDYEHNEYDHEYNEDEEEESGEYYSCDGEAVIKQGSSETTCENARIIVIFDQDVCSPKILITDSGTGEILADMLISTDTEFEISSDTTCKWSGTDFTSNDPVEKSVTVNFPDSEVAAQFHESCETLCKGASLYRSDPES